MKIIENNTDIINDILYHQFGRKSIPTIVCIESKVDLLVFYNPKVNKMGLRNFLILNTVNYFLKSDIINKTSKYENN